MMVALRGFSSSSHSRSLADDTIGTSARPHDPPSAFRISSAPGLSLPEPGAPVLLDGEEVGELRSGSGDRALALLKVEAARGGSALMAGDARVTPEVPAWMRLPEATSP